MSDCETCEMSISALADGELPADELLPTLDHLAACPSCQAFYRDLRALAGALPLVTGSSRRLSEPAEAPEAVWHRIEAAAPELSRSRRPLSWALRLAAVLVLAAGLWGLFSTLRSTLRPDAPIEITLGEDRGRMTEQRFVDLTVELLRADPRYHQEMLQVLTVVLQRSSRQESPVDRDAPLPEGDRGETGDEWAASGGRLLS